MKYDVIQVGNVDTQRVKWSANAKTQHVSSHDDNSNYDFIIYPPPGCVYSYYYSSTRRRNNA